MAGSSDRARFYLEQSIPELQELQRKKIFTKASRFMQVFRELNSNRNEARSQLGCKEKIRV